MATIIPPNILAELQRQLASHGPDASVVLEYQGFGVGRQAIIPAPSFYHAIASLRERRPEVAPVDETVAIIPRDRQTKTVIVQTPDLTTWTNRRRVYQHRLDAYGYLVMVDVTTPTSPVTLTVEPFRRQRWTFSYPDQHLTFLFTAVQAESGTTFDIRVVADEMGLPSLNRAASSLFGLVNETANIYTSTLRADLIRYVNTTLGGFDRDDIFDHAPYVQARNLKRDDLVMGGLVGNRRTPYKITHKADGVRRILVIYRRGVWLIMYPSSINLVMILTDDTLEGYILDGERIDPPQRREGAPTSRYWFIGFDCLARPIMNSTPNLPSTDIQFEPLTLREQACRVVADYFRPMADAPLAKQFVVTTKSSRIITTVDEFFLVFRRFLDEQTALPYAVDGLLFTPELTPYNSHSNDHPIGERILLRYPDICKWKPPDRLTIDFAIRRDHGTIHLYARRGARTLVLPPHLPQAVDPNDPLLATLPDQAVVEFAWSTDHNYWVAKRWREDKATPNTVEIALSVWRDIQRPLTEAIMTGETFTFVRRYHNRIKRALFDRPPGKHLTLLDIGSGRGSDLAKWAKYERVIALEPDPENLSELQRRINQMQKQNQIVAYPLRGDDPAAVTAAVRATVGGPVDVISLMLSLTFFWLNSAALDGLITTIVENLKPTGTLLFLTMDGDIVRQVFRPALGHGPILDDLRLGPAYLRYEPGTETHRDQLFIDIADSIVHNQTEGLTHLDDLTIRLAPYGFAPALLERADKDTFLSQPERLFTSMYSYGAYTKGGPRWQDVVNNEPTNLEELESLLPPLTAPPAGSASQALLTVPPRSTNLPPMAPVSPILSRPNRGLSPLPPPTNRGPLPPPTNRGQPRRPVSNVTQPIGMTNPPVTSQPVQGRPRRNVTQPIGMTNPPVTSQPASRGRPRRSVPRSAQTTQPRLTPPAQAQESYPVQNQGISTLDPNRESPKEIPSLSVTFDMNADRAVGDDTYMPVPNNKYNQRPVVRIATIADGSCFFHAVLKAYLDIYADNPSLRTRLDLVAGLRKDLAQSLYMINPATGRSYYESFNDGQWDQLHQWQTEGADLRTPQGELIDYSIEGMYHLFNSTRDVGDEVYSYVADHLGIDVVVVTLLGTDIRRHLDTIQPGRNRPIVVIAGNGSHYETLAIDHGPETGFQTVFYRDDPFIEALIGRP